MTTKPTYEVLVCAFNSKGEVLTVNSKDVLQLPRGEPTENETQRQAAVRILKEQAGFIVQENDMVALVYDKLKDDHFVLSYLCTKVLEPEMQQGYVHKWSDGTCGWNTACMWCVFLGTREFLDNCDYAEYHHTALYHANTLSKQLQLPNVFSQTQIVKHREAHEDIKKITVESKLNKQKGTEMQNEITKEQTTKALELVNGGEYVTRKGETVKMSVDEYCRPGQAYHQFLGSNGFYYKTNGMLFNFQEDETDVVRDVQPEGELLTKVNHEIELQVTCQNRNGFTPSEIQSLIQMQSKIITALEVEILELKETAAYLGGNLNSRLQELRKKIYNEITSKQKRLGKLVVLQTKLKRAK